MADQETQGSSPVDVARVVRVWWPLAASWLLMSAELPMTTAAMMRMSERTVNLAAFGSIALPLSMVIEAPIIMMLAASTSLARDRDSCRRLHRFMTGLAIALTLLHVLVAFTPLFDLVVRRWMGVAHPEIAAQAQLAMQLMTPWTWSIAHRRFHQGLLIRAERSHAIGIGTVVRLLANAAVLGLGLVHGGFSGAAVAAAATSTGVLAEAVFVRWQSSDALAALAAIPPKGLPLSIGAMVRFYVPLALTPLLMLAGQPIGAAAMTRMPGSLASLAVWPVVMSALFIVRAPAVAFNEVVVMLAELPGARRALEIFRFRMMLVSSAVVLAVAGTPLGTWWFGHVLGLSPAFVDLARLGVALGALLPALQSWISLLQGVLVSRHQTRAIPEAMVVYLGVMAGGLGLGVFLQPPVGLAHAVVALVAAVMAQAIWLRRRVGVQ